MEFSSLLEERRSIRDYQSGVVISKDDIEKYVMDETQRKLIVAKNRLFGKTNLNGIVLSYDEKSKRIYGEHDNLHKMYGWEKPEEFQDVVNEETPFN